MHVYKEVCNRRILTVAGIAVYIIQLLSVTIMCSGFVTPIGSNLLKKACPEPNLQLKPCFLRPKRDENIDC